MIETEESNNTSNNMMPSIRLALIPFLLSFAASENTAPNNVSSRLMIHVSAEFVVVKSCMNATLARTYKSVLIVRGIEYTEDCSVTTKERGVFLANVRGERELLHRSTTCKSLNSIARAT